MDKYDVVLEELDKLDLNDTNNIQNDNNSIKETNLENTTSEESQDFDNNEDDLFKNIFDSISDGISILDKNLGIKLVNKTMKKLYENKLPFTDKKCYEVYQNRGTLCPWCPSIKAMEHKSVHSTIVPYPDESNPKGWILLTCYPLTNKFGNVYGVIEQVSDITEHKKVEDRFRIISEVTTDLIYEWDLKNDKLEWFGDIDGVLGYETGEIDKSINGWINLIHPDDLKKLSNSVERHRTETRPIEETYRVRKKDGTWVYWEDRGKPILDNHGKPVKWIGGCKDITQQKEMEQELKNKIEKLERYKKITINRELRIKELKQKIRSCEGNHHEKEKTET